MRHFKVNRAVLTIPSATLTLLYQCHIRRVLRHVSVVLLPFVFILLSPGFSISATSGPTVNDFDSPGTPYSITLYSPGQTPPTVYPAGPSGNFLRLTHNKAGIAAVSFDRTYVGVSQTIIADFDFRMIPMSSGRRADGLGFVLLDTAAYGVSGPTLAAGGGPDPGFDDAIGIGFDIYRNWYDPNNNHLSLHYDGDTLGTFNPGFDLANGVFNHAHVEIDFVDGGANVSVVLTPDIFGNPGDPVTVISDHFVRDAIPFESRVRFACETGGLSADHDVDNVLVRFETDYQFDEFALGRLTISFDDGESSDAYSAVGGFQLSEASDGLDVLSEDLIVSVGPSSTAIPAGSFMRDGTRYVFEGTLDGVQVKAALQEVAFETYFFRFHAAGIGLSGCQNPDLWTLTIGNDSGRSLEWLSGSLEAQKEPPEETPLLE